MPRCQLSKTKSDLCSPLLHFRSTKQNPFKMKANFLSTSVALVALATSTIAHNIQMGAHSRECFHEQLHKDDKMTVTFQVGDREFGGAGNLEIDFWVRALPSLRRLRFAKSSKRAAGIEPKAIEIKSHFLLYPLFNQLLILSFPSSDSRSLRQKLHTRARCFLRRPQLRRPSRRQI